jgi:hypothetical protein
MNNIITTNDEESPLAPFRVKDSASADWVLSKIAAIDAEKALIQAQAEQRIKELDADRERLLFRFSGELEAFARAEAEKRRRKTITLLHGSLSLRTSPARLTIADIQDAITTAKAILPEAVSTVEKLDTTAYRKYAESKLHETGEILPGCEITEASETFSIQTGSKRKSDAGSDGGQEDE